MPSTFVIDLHSGGVEYLFLPVAGFYGEMEGTNASFRAARSFGLPSLWQLPPTDGVMSDEASNLGKVAIGHEYLGAGQLSPEGTLAYVQGTMNCLREWSILSAEPVAADVTEQSCFTGDWQLANTVGLFLPHVASWQRSRQGCAAGRNPQRTRRGSWNHLRALCRPGSGSPKQSPYSPRSLGSSAREERPTCLIELEALIECRCYAKKHPESGCNASPAACVSRSHLCSLVARVAQSPARHLSWRCTMRRASW